MANALCSTTYQAAPPGRQGRASRGRQAGGRPRTASGRPPSLGLILRGAGLVFPLTGTVLMDESFEPGTIKRRKGPAGPGAVNRLTLGK